MKRILFTALGCSLAAVMLVAWTGCTKKKDYKGNLELVYVEWSSEVASTNVARAVLQERMNYKVEITPVSASVMWGAIASGDADGMVAAWLPTTHGHYLEKIKDKVDNLGKNLEGTRIGLVVPNYVDINSLTDLKSNAEKFKGKIIGIDPGAGLMIKTEAVMKEYGLDNFTLMEGSDATMVAALADAIKNKEWIVITGWTPHWKFAKWDLKYLDDPKNIYGGSEYIGTIVRKGLKEEMPEVHSFLSKFKWSPEDMADVMMMNEKKGADTYQNAVKWINKNKGKVDAWLN